MIRIFVNLFQAGFVKIDTLKISAVLLKTFA